jgi:hypothetical protein
MEKRDMEMEIEDVAEENMCSQKTGRKNCGRNGRRKSPSNGHRTDR